MTKIFQKFISLHQTQQIQRVQQTKSQQVGPPQGDSTTAQMARKGAMTVLSEYTSESRLKTTEPTPQSLEAKGFEKSKGPLDGAEYYKNPNTGEKIRIKTNKQNGNKCYEYQNGNMQHSVIYDKNGKATGGNVQIKEQDGTLTIIKYSFDEKGNKIITDVESKSCSAAQSGFYDNDGQF